MLELYLLICVKTVRTLRNVSYLMPKTTSFGRPYIFAPSHD